MPSTVWAAIPSFLCGQNASSLYSATFNQSTCYKYTNGVMSVIMRISYQAYERYANVCDERTKARNIRYVAHVMGQLHCFSADQVFMSMMVHPSALYIAAMSPTLQSLTPPVLSARFMTCFCMMINTRYPGPPCDSFGSPTYSWFNYSAKCR